MPQPYQPPVVETLGTVEELTEAFNKTGPSEDAFTTITNGQVVGSIGPVGP